MIDNYYTISEFANMFHKTRQTFIYYDKIDLFKPSLINEHGYRLYGPEKVKEFIEIAQLLDAGVKLNDLKKIINDRDKQLIINVLDEALINVDNEIRNLKTRKIHLDNRRQYYNLNLKDIVLMQPFVQTFNDRYCLFESLKHESNNSLQDDINDCFTNIFKNFNDICNMSSVGVGVKYDYNDLISGNYYDHLNTFIMVDSCSDIIKNTKLIDGGMYLCMYHYGLHSNPDSLKYLLDYAKCHGYEIVGDALELCILDNYFFVKMQDLLCLQLLVKKISK